MSNNVPSSFKNVRRVNTKNYACQSKWLDVTLGSMDQATKIDPIEAENAFSTVVLAVNMIRSNAELSEASRRTMLSYIRNLSPQLLTTDYRQLTGMHLQREFLLMQSNGRPPLQAARRLWVLRSLLKKAREMGLVFNDSVFTVRIAAKEKVSDVNKRALNPEEVLQVYQAAAVDRSLKEVDRHLAATFVLSVACGGSRVGDTVRLKEEHIQGGRVRFTASKNRYQVDLPFTERLTFALHALRGSQSAPYLTPWLKPYPDDSYDNVNKATTRLAQRMRRLNLGGLGITFHDSRRITAMMLSEAGHSPSTVANVVGWFNTKQVHVYSKHQTVEAVDDAFKKLG